MKLFAAALLTSIYAVDWSQCRLGWCYYKTPSKMTWDTANKTCIGLGAHLASIHSYEENQYLYDLCGRNKNCWIGLNDVRVKTKWEWTDGTPLDFTRWNRYEPSHRANERWVHIWGKFGGKWNDHDNSHVKYAFCKKAHTSEAPTREPTLPEFDGENCPDFRNLRECYLANCGELCYVSASECPKLFPQCNSDGNCVTEICSDGCQWKIDDTWTPGSSTKESDSNYIRGYDNSFNGSHYCNANFNEKVLNCPETVGDGWILVRHAPAGRKWHKAQDNLLGFDEYGIPSGPASKSYWSIKFNTVPFDQFLFAQANCNNWLIVSRESVLGANGELTYDGKHRPIIASSVKDTPYRARWYKRTAFKEDPWISIHDHPRDVLYGEASDGEHSQLLGSSGVNVWIRFTNASEVDFISVDCLAFGKTHRIYLKYCPGEPTYYPLSLTESPTSFPTCPYVGDWGTPRAQWVQVGCDRDGVYTEVVQNSITGAFQEIDLANFPVILEAGLQFEGANLSREIARVLALTWNLTQHRQIRNTYRCDYYDNLDPFSGGCMWRLQIVIDHYNCTSMSVVSWMPHVIKCSRSKPKCSPFRACLDEDCSECNSDVLSFQHTIVYV